MRPLTKTMLGGGVAAAALFLGFQFAEMPTVAADHLDPPQRTDPSEDATPDRAADIADLYTFYGDGTVKMILTFAGPAATDQPATYDPDVRYYINVSNAAPRTQTDVPILIQFGEDEGMPGTQYGVRVSGLPGVSGDIIGPVESNLQRDGVRVRAGLFDDPFFFDLQGFKETRDTGDLSFDSSRDFFAGQNITAVVIEIPQDRIENGDNLVDVWAESLRLGGNI
ncbi:DUF4331 family protein [Sphingomicrobium sp. XHP0235]|uniref:DUF4331 family protein n=1 Tax=Sphingomicrobium aquimarinum TaxID=3133971 RepID=UPI0031FED368